MPWVQSHSNLRTHPKLKRAARLAGCSQPEMAGHLHFLWWWALETQPDGDLSVWEAEDIADAAGWEGDPHTFVTALLDCGPGDKRGFLDPDMHCTTGTSTAARTVGRLRRDGSLQSAVGTVKRSLRLRFRMPCHWQPTSRKIGC
jgi:hypothetical protein